MKLNTIHHKFSILHVRFEKKISKLIDQFGHHMRASCYPIPHPSGQSLLSKAHREKSDREHLWESSREMPYTEPISNRCALKQRVKALGLFLPNIVD